MIGAGADVGDEEDITAGDLDDLDGALRTVLLGVQDIRAHSSLLIAFVSFGDPVVLLSIILLLDGGNFLDPVCVLASEEDKDSNICTLALTLLVLLLLPLALLA